MRRIAERPTRQGYETRATLADGREKLLSYETTDEALLATAPVVPAQDDHVVIVASDRSEGPRACVGVSIHPVVGWRVYRGGAVPICAGFDPTEEPHALLVSAFGVCQAVRLDNSKFYESTWAWLDQVLDDFQRDIDADRKAIA
ncbi:hypothetical protein M2320_002688 [Rhodoblastus acidophilus]|nr:hypothetical protein [Rhodoblastus acidophilus]